MTHIVYTELIQGLGYLNLLGSVKEGIGKLLSFSERALNDLEFRDIAQKIPDRLVWIPARDVWVLCGLDSGKTVMS